MDRIAALFRRPADPRTDGQLLAAFLRDRDDPAFAELVRRHGPLVWGVCRRSLPDPADAEDAFQATFLVLVRRAGRLAAAPAVGPWLLKVAAWTARNARRKNARRLARFAELPAAVPDTRPAIDPDVDFDAVLRGLPGRCRAAVLMCHLEGLTHREAADRLGCAEGTVSSLVSRGLARVRARFAGRDPAAALAAAAAAAPAGVAAATVRSAAALRLASLSAAAPPAAAALARGVLRSFWVKKAAGFAAVLLLGVGFGAGVSVRQSPRADGRENPAANRADPGAAELVKQLGDPDFPTREAATKKLRDLGAGAIPALQSGTRDPNPEVARRSREVLLAVRADRREALARQFDPAKTEEYDHPVWKRFVTIAGDSRASRELFARVIANGKWLRTLDKADADPANAGHVYRVGLAEVFRDFHNDPAKSPPWPCDRPEEVAYLLLLGSYPDPDPPAKLTGDEVVPTNLRNTDFLGRGIIRGEGQIVHARGLELGLEGKWFVWQSSPAAAGTDRVFARLLAAWLARRTPSADVVPNALRVAATYRATETLPTARRYAANDSDPKRDIPPLVTIRALELVAQLGTRADLPIFERHFGDETNVAAVDPPRPDGARDYHRPAPVTESTRLRDVALGLALLLHGADPADFGFVVRKDTFQPNDGRYTIPWSTQLHLGFDGEVSRAAAFRKAKEWLDKQPKPKKDDPAPDPAVAKLVEQLGASEFADREAAQKALRELGLKARPELRAGLKSENPEVRERAATALAAIRRDRLWVAFAKAAGEDKAAQDLFAKVVASTRAADAIEAALDDPARADELYRARTAELLRVAAGHPPVDDRGEASVPSGPAGWGVPPVSPGDVAGWMLLGSLQSGTGAWRDVTHPDWAGQLSSHIAFLPEDDYTTAKLIAEAYAARDAAPLKKLTAAWLGRRRENDTLRAGLALALRYDITDALAAARNVLKGPEPADVSPWNLAAVAIFVGLHGTKDDLPLLARHAADDRSFGSWLDLPPGTDLTFTPPPKEGRDLFCHVRDAVAVAMCKLADKNPADFGFPPFPATKDPGGAPTSLSSATKVGFKSKADRAAAFEKASGWLKSFEPPAEPKPGPKKEE